MRLHRLKTWPEPFQAVLDGRKTHEARVDDRGFAVGDGLVLLEYEPMTSSGFGALTCRWAIVTVEYVTPGGRFGVERGACVMSVKLLERGCGDGARFKAERNLERSTP